MLAFKHEGENEKFSKSKVQSIVQQVQQWWSCCDQSPSGRLLFVVPNIPYPEILFSCVCTLGVLYTCSPTLGFGGRASEIFFWDMCCATVLWTHGIGLTLEFSHFISPIQESIVNRLGIVLEERLWEREEEVQRFCCRVYPFIFLDCNKRTSNFFVDVAHRLGEPRYICVSL